MDTRQPADIYFRVLGPVSVERGGVPVDIGGRQPRATLALLLLRAGRIVTMDELVDALWGDSPPETCRTRVHGLISGLRKTLGDDVPSIETMAPGYRLEVPPDRLDLAEFERDLRAARERASAGDFAAAADLYRRALSRWHGGAFADVSHPVVREAAAGLEDKRLAAIEERIDAEMALGRHRDLVSDLDVLVSEHPLREGLVAKYMTALARSGRAADALTVFRRARERLVEELAIEPSDHLQGVHQAILTGQMSPPSPFSATEPAPKVPRQLPPEEPGLVGRDELIKVALAAVREQSAAGPCCLVMAGPGGIGKTAIAVRLSHLMRRRFPDGQLYARLGGSRLRRRDVRPVLSQFLYALGVSVDGMGTSIEDLSGLFQDVLADRRVLVLLDDVADKATLEPFLPVGTGSLVIATSRRRVDESGIVRVVPVVELAADEGMELLRAVVGAKRVAAEESAAADIVSLCGGLPLAIRTAGARLAGRPNWSFAHMARRLADDRGRLDWLELGNSGVRASIAASYAGLGPDRQRLFRLLGLMSPPEFPSWLPAALLDQPINVTERILDDLVDVHLVEPAGAGVTGPRYLMHDLVHLFAGELAAANGPDGPAAVGRALNGLLDLAEVADAGIPHWYGRDPAPRPHWRAPEEARESVRADPHGWFDDERQLLHAAVRRAADEGHPEVAWGLAQCLSTYLDMRGSYGEWAEVLRQGLRAAEAAGDRPGTACMLGLLVDAEANQDHFDASVGYAHRAVAAYDAMAGGPSRPEDPPSGTPSRALGASASLREYERSLAAARRAEDPVGIGFSAFSLAVAYRHAGVHEGYLALFEEARAAFHACGARLSELWAVKNIGLSSVKRRRMDETLECLLRGEAVIRNLGDRLDSTGMAEELSHAYTAQGRYEEAEALLSKHLRESRRHGHLWDEGRTLDAVGRVRRARGDPDSACNAHLAALAIWRRLRATLRINRTMNELAGICEELGDLRSAEFYRRECAKSARENR